MLLVRVLGTGGMIGSSRNGLRRVGYYSISAPHPIIACCRQALQLQHALARKSKELIICQCKKMLLLKRCLLLASHRSACM